MTAGPLTSASPQQKHSSRLLWAIALVSLLGFGLALDLTRIHVLVHTDPSYHSICAVSDGLNCETVARSPYSVFAGLPVSVWGLMGYGLMATLAFWGISRWRLHRRWGQGLLLVLSAFAASASLALAYISATRIDSLCLFCLASYLVNLTLLALNVINWRRSATPLRELLADDLGALRQRPTLGAAGAAAALTTLIAAQLVIPTYWQSPGWHTLPKLPHGVDGNGQHWIGANSPKLTIVEYSDYQCPFCRVAHKRIRSLAAKHAEKVRLVHRHLPLGMACHPGIKRPFHPHACRFAEAAECAGEQGKFWAMNDALFAVQETCKASEVDPVDLAVRLGLDRSRFRRCLAEQCMAPKVAADTRAALALKIRGTPCFVVGKKAYMGKIPAEELERLLQQRCGTTTKAPSSPSPKR